MASILDLYILDPLSNFVKEWSADMPLEINRNSSIQGSWYLSPKQHAIEFILYNFFFSYGIEHFLAKALAKNTPTYNALKKAMKEAPTRRSRLDILFLILLCSSLSLVVIYKLYRKTTIFLLQPCHVSMASLILLLLYNPKKEAPHIGFNIYLHTIWGTILALLVPDLRDCDLFFERYNFWIEHLLLLITPVYILLKRRLALFPLTPNLAFAAFFFKALYHSLLLSLVSLIFGVNVNYLLLPPPGTLEVFSHFYRLVMYVFSCGMTFLTRYLFVEIIVRSVGVHSKTS
ncbi:hypothetical protein HMI54_010035 [Coelomomyces lativittatus]|nr:hypothetical protein HMI54_010035 [Coelomomyces lativittatus]KAJ1504240.1 hypothetical protein HMI56_001724 [Coelomomyces lativittatus]KAJ1505630.1 hypothetical protein HMI55_001519 [Coelomomyces lativittatus]